MDQSKTKLALLLSASVIAAVRTARDEIAPTPKIKSAVADSLRLAKMLLESINKTS
jgi:hypothetical protein